MGGYFDNNATTPLGPAAREAWLRTADRFWQNPSGLYRDGAEARRVLEDAREALADLLDVDPGRVIFTAGATEGNNAVAAHTAHTGPPAGVAVASGVEHPSVSAPLRRWFGRARTRVVEVSDEGVVLLESIKIDMKAGRVALVSVMAANNETGVVQPWEEVAALCADAGVPFHCDAVQWFGKVGTGGFGRCTYVTGSAHKFGGPKGTGFLLVPEGDAGGFVAQVGGPQEAGRRAGTEDVAGVVAMVAALESARPGTPEGRDRFERELLRLVPGARVIGGGAPRLWNTSMVLLPAHKNLKWLTRLDRRGFRVSTGSACSAGRENPSEVMEAIGLRHEEMGRVLRASGSAGSTVEDWVALAAACGEVWQELKGTSEI